MLLCYVYFPVLWAFSSFNFRTNVMTATFLSIPVSEADNKLFTRFTTKNTIDTEKHTETRRHKTEIEHE